MEADLILRDEDRACFAQWWAAAESVDVVLGLLERGMDAAAREFARDALAAARGQSNPRAWWLR